MKVRSYIKGHWVEKGRETDLISAVTGKTVARMLEADLDYAGACEYARREAGPALRAMSIHERAFSIKFLAQHLLERKEDYYELSAHTGATRGDSWIDIEGGIGSMFTLSSKARIELSDLPYHVEGGHERLSRNGTFVGQHICVPRHGVAVHINAFNFPVWGMLEKLAPAIISGMPVIIKPSPTGSYLACKVFEDMLGSKLLPGGAIQFIAADKPGDLLDRLNSQDSVSFTGSARTGRKLKVHPNIVARNVRFNLEADSLNCSILGADVTPGMQEFDLFVNEVVNEMTVKTGQKCTAIRRTIVPEQSIDAVLEALKRELDQTAVGIGVGGGGPGKKKSRMGPLASLQQAERFDKQVSSLLESAELVYRRGNVNGNGKGNGKGKGKGSRSGNGNETGRHGGGGAFTDPKVLLCHKPMVADAIHKVEAFGPLTTVMPYGTTGEAIALANKADGSLVGSLFTADDHIARKITLGCAPYHGRFMVINRNCAEESTGHGSPMPHLVHGGPGHAGGGEELGGARAVLHNMQRVALQGSPTTLKNITRQYIPGAKTGEAGKHPFQQYFEDLEIGEALITHRRTVTEADIVNFGGISGDHFYAHFDETAARDSFFGKRVAHGYFVLSAAAGLFVDPAPGPVLLNYGLENLRFTKPVAPGDTIRAKLIVKRKTVRQKKAKDKYPYGMVFWDVEVTNQHEEIVADYTILTLVKRRNTLDMDILEEEKN